VEIYRTKNRHVFFFRYVDREMDINEEYFSHRSLIFPKLVILHTVIPNILLYSYKYV
jgi:hypothetical protein